MKMQRTAALVALLTTCYLQSPAQTKTPPINEPNYNKAKIFGDIPAKTDINITTLEGLFKYPVGESINTSIANGFRFVGTVVSKSNPADRNVKSVVVKSTSRQKATLTFSKITNQDGSVRYTGRILSRDASDAMEIIKEGDKYVIVKKDYYDMINE
ncbi:MAG: hypothetical protein EOO10_09900 [Chitinophagaceae bacterium]|nr:MAG: hypothetical protein EOO10_09900 [Chitinophagaceae bacterium]